MSKYITFLIFGLLLPVGALGQTALRSLMANKSTQLTIELPVKKKTGANKSSGKKAEEAPQYELYREIGRRNTWIVGLGDPISEETAMQLPYYYRFSMKNSKGHYQFIQAMHGDSLTSRHPFTPYILDKRFSLIENSDTPMSDWGQQITQIGQWLITSDLSGDEVVEERAYEAVPKNANLIYAYLPVKTDANTITASYIDSWGLPVDVEESDDHYYGNVLRIIQSKNGTDSIIDYLDGKGLRRYYEENIDQRRDTYDEHGRLRTSFVCNLAGDHINRENGVSGQYYEYSKDGSLWIHNADAQDHLAYNPNPVYPQMLAGHVCVIRFDELGRIIEERILDGHYRSANNKDGIYRITIKYHDNGHLRTVEKYQLDEE